MKRVHTVRHTTRSRIALRGSDSEHILESIMDRPRARGANLRTLDSSLDPMRRSRWQKQVARCDQRLRNDKFLFFGRDSVELYEGLVLFRFELHEFGHWRGHGQPGSEMGSRIGPFRTRSSEIKKIIKETKQPTSPERLRCFFELVRTKNIGQK